MARHNLKELSVYLEQTIDGDENFAIRQNDDRGFQRGDTIFVTEIIEEGSHNPNNPRTYQADVTNVCTYKQREGYVVLGIQLTHVNYKAV
jgi:hypothetical protein